MPEGHFSDVPFSFFKNGHSFGEGGESHNKGFASVVIFIPIKGMYHDRVQNAGSEDV